VRTAGLLLGFAVSVWLRVVVGGSDVARSVTAGLVFAGCLLALSWAARLRVPVSWRAVALGLLGILVVCLPVGLEHLVTVRPLRGTAGFVPWALAVVVVASAEELFLRGALFDALRSPRVAVVVGAVCFALLHVPLYGWQAVPLDLAVGLVLGGLRVESGTPLAPAITHVGADLVGWFLR
jgi:membrane protease YdiL (CAAX protease family)